MAVNDESAPLLDIRDLQVAFRAQGKSVPAVRGASLTVYPGQTVAIVGESGSGKSTTAAAVLTSSSPSSCRSDSLTGAA